MVLNQPVGVPRQNPTDYTGPDMCLIPIKRFPREPLVTDKRYRIGQFAILGRDPSTGQEGELWYLANFFPNGDANWVQFASGMTNLGIQKILTDDGDPPVVQDGTAEVQLFGGPGITTTGQGPGSLININLDGSLVGQTLTADTGGPLSPVAGNWNIFGDAIQGSVTSGAGNTVTITNTNASETQIGVSELATDAEAIDGTDSIRVIVPTSLKAKLGVQTDDGMAFGQGTTSPLGWTSGLTDGQLPIGSTAGVPAAANLTEGTGITITNGANSIEISGLSTTRPAFLAKLDANQLNVTGNGAVYTVEFPNIIFDQGGDYDGIDTFTAPITGLYVFYTAVQMDELTAATGLTQVNIATTARSLVTQTVNGANARAGGSNTVILNGALFTNMTAGDTCQITVQAADMPGNTIDMVTTTSNFFGGYLVT